MSFKFHPETHTYINISYSQACREKCLRSAGAMVPGAEGMEAATVGPKGPTTGGMVEVATDVDPEASPPSPKRCWIE